ncbi:MAG: isopentenyl-diphosphate Delta-isomerase [Sphingobacteriales bacterium]|nr:isopentenyl-diphosphate Delta-isomerase [Sphingobacteriales bacterium]
MDSTEVILVDENDKPFGVASKLMAHKEGLLHRAFSIFIFNTKGDMLLQQRAKSKYHSGGLWSNACCSHPQPGQDTQTAAERRLFEEMGFSTSIEKIFDFIYKAEFENGLIEHEFDHVFTGEYEGEIKINEGEAEAYCYKNIREISKSLQTHPEKYTAWFHLAFPRIEQWWVLRYKSEAA